MKSLIKIAWRSLWRNKRRTLITSASVFLAVFLALFMRSMQIGSYEMMTDMAVREAGHLQIHKNGYWEKKSINYFMDYSNEIKREVESNPNISIAIPRMDNFALASYGDLTKGVAIQGIIPDMTDDRINLSKRIVKGRYLKENDTGVVLAEGLANYLKIDVNDTLVLLGQGYQGISAAAIYPVVGIVKFPIPKLNNLMMYMHLDQAQETFAPYNPDLISALVIELKDVDDLSEEANILNERIGFNYEVLSWEQMLQEVVQQIESDNAGGIVMLGILYLIVAFGIFSTVLMMTVERRREFAIMVAVGLNRSKLAIITLFETILIAIIGVIAGVIFSVPVLQYFHHNPIPLTGDLADMMLEFNYEPIMPFSLESFIFVSQGLTVLLIAMGIAIYPMIYAYWFKLLKAMRK
ncbi:MAG: hypothetical protein CL663_02480 [Bacteroidetes bacterium]|nr:hypothetical protein [Bacteroidota bacterium]